MVSIGTQIKQLSALLETSDLSDWMSEFLGGIVDRTDEGKNTAALTEKQIGVIEREYKKHFAG